MMGCLFLFGLKKKLAIASITLKCIHRRWQQKKERNPYGFRHLYNYRKKGGFATSLWRKS
jgi:hypothetical protein